MMKLLDKERKKRKELKVEKLEPDEEAPIKDREIITGDLIVSILLYNFTKLFFIFCVLIELAKTYFDLFSHQMVVKQSEPLRPVAPVLNGREAELADPDYQSEDEGEEGNSKTQKKTTQHKFAQPDHMKIILESKHINMDLHYVCC